MCKRGDAARVVNAADDFFGRGAESRDEGGLAPFEPAIEGLADARDVSAGHQCLRNPWASRGLARVVDRRTQDPIGVERDPAGGELVDHLPYAIDAPPTLILEKREQVR